ncbi:hypothetical protein ACS85_12415 [Vibrio parahaemolyticus]|nr:hypothetical protein ACS85_12415 [Vibrio parahaemolyticus]
MNIKISFITACILRDHCNVSKELVRQIDAMPVKAEIVHLSVSRIEMKQASIELKKYMSSSDGYHKETFDFALKEVEYFGKFDT